MSKKSKILLMLVMFSILTFIGISSNSISINMLDVNAATGSHTHTFNGSYTVTKSATCASTGTKVAKCTSCGKVLQTVTIPKTSTHSWSSWTVTKKATCTSDGSESRTCKTCGKTETKTINGSHKFDEYNACTVCGKIGNGTIDDMKAYLKSKGVSDKNITYLFSAYNSEYSDGIGNLATVLGYVGNASGIDKISEIGSCISNLNSLAKAIECIDILQNPNSSDISAANASIDLLSEACSLSPLTSTYGDILQEMKGTIDYIIVKNNEKLTQCDLALLMVNYNYSLDELTNKNNFDDLYNYCLDEYNGNKEKANALFLAYLDSLY